MKLSHKTILELAYAHGNLDGVKDTSFKFSAKVRYSLSKNHRILKSRSEDINKVRTGLIRELTEEGAIKDGSPEMAKFEKAYTEFLELEEDIPNIMQFNLSDLNLETNQIPVSTLSALGPLLIEEEPLTAK